MFGYIRENKNKEKNIQKQKIDSFFSLFIVALAAACRQLRGISYVQSIRIYNTANRACSCEFVILTECCLR